MSVIINFLDNQFRGSRTAYSSSSIFLLILQPPDIDFDAELIGEAIYSDKFSSINPPGPSFGFGHLVLHNSEEDGVIEISTLLSRNDCDDQPLTMENLLVSLNEYIDGFFVVDEELHVQQVEFMNFQKLLFGGKRYTKLRICEFEPY